MKRWIFILLVIGAMLLMWWTMHLFLNKKPQEHTTLKTFEEIESWRE